ncbi:sorcin-like isoform X2 [Littorina saxatilis]|uniref:EF-hand domain-containing protein n=2 Tax=Littorina saxatilis TaxID=31220 RepID=A0AAN9BPI7_9CAEN
MYGAQPYPTGSHSFPGQGGQGGDYQQHQQQFAMQQQQALQHLAQFQQQRTQHYQHYQQQSQHYGQYGQYYQQNVFSVNAWQAYQFQSPNDLEQVFRGIMQRNPENAMRNAIQAEDLMNVLNNTPTIRNYFGISWSREMSSIMLAMLDRSKDGFMQWEEFMELQQCLVAWYKVFKQHDADGSGFMDAQELTRVIKQLFGFQIQPPTLTTILKRYSRVVAPNSRCILAFDDFVALSVRLRAYTDAFRKRDSMANGVETGSCNFQYDDFLQCVLCL